MTTVDAYATLPCAALCGPSVHVKASCGFSLLREGRTLQNSIGYDGHALQGTERCQRTEADELRILGGRCFHPFCFSNLMPMAASLAASSASANDPQHLLTKPKYD